MNDILKRIENFGVIPVIKVTDIKTASPLAKALCAGGLPVAEITFRTECAADAIREIKSEIPNMLIGAGTVLTVAQVDQAIEAGAEFIVSPGFNSNVVEHCINCGITVIPGCSTPSDIESAIEMGLDTVKFFPAEASGGVKMIKALSAPYHGIKFMPTGGINLDNLVEYLSCPSVLACGGSFMVKDELLADGDYNAIKELTKNVLMTMFGFKLRHIGVNCPDEGAAKRAALLTETLFGFETRETPLAIFAGEGFEFMKKPFLGTMGHIAIATNSIDRAIAYFERMGFEFNYADSIKAADGKFAAVYFKDEFFNFALHLSRA